MGTNYYGRRKLNYPLNFTNIERMEDLQKTQKEIENLLTEIHLGKTSNGKFLAQWNNGNFYNTKPEYIEFVKALDIKDEYGRSVTFDKFLQIIEDDKGKSHHLASHLTDEGWAFLDGEWF